MTVYEKQPLSSLIKIHIGRTRASQRFTKDQLETLQSVYTSGLNVKEAAFLTNATEVLIRHHWRRFKKAKVETISMIQRIDLILEGA